MQGFETEQFGWVVENLFREVIDKACKGVGGDALHVLSAYPPEPELFMDRPRWSGHYAVEYRTAQSKSRPKSGFYWDPRMVWIV
mmetsp:Transcript_17747/g.36054  ORF Transcript_17747/g.36054 Transcript_17747/m.36054 type:complete len:84 (+) Transcript_17747:854-1105(+)